MITMVLKSRDILQRSISVFLRGVKRRSNPLEFHKAVRLPRFPFTMLWVSAHRNDKLFVFRLFTTSSSLLGQFFLLQPFNDAIGNIQISSAASQLYSFNHVAVKIAASGCNQLVPARQFLIEPGLKLIVL